MQETIIIIITSFIGFLLLNHVKRSFILYSFISMPGTILHELSHAIVSLVLNGKPIDINLVPKKIKENGNTYYLLGYVTSSNVRWYNAIFIGLSPIIIFYFGYIILTSELDAWMKIIILPLVIDSGIPSIQDIKISLISFPAILAIISIIGSVYMFYPESFQKIMEKIYEIYIIN